MAADEREPKKPCVVVRTIRRRKTTPKKPKTRTSGAKKAAASKNLLAVAATREDRAGRDSAILNYRLQGLTLQEISRQLPLAGYGQVGVSRIHAILTDVLRSCVEAPARELRQLELLRLDQLQRAHYEAALAGDAPAISRVLSIMDRRAKLLGLESHARGEEGSSLAQARQSLLDKLDALARRGRNERTKPAAAASGSPEKKDKAQ